jgi:hypothetical protein
MIGVSPVQSTRVPVRPGVASTYERLARNPYAPHHLHRGPYYARYYLGYAEADLESVPTLARDRCATCRQPIGSTGVSGSMAPSSRP